jgi:hypothetical protein
MVAVMVPLLPPIHDAADVRIDGEISHNQGSRVVGELADGAGGISSPIYAAY